jgi:RimJ/RimL family protein N-acetyltransferase
VTAAGGAWLDVSLSCFSLLLMGLTTIRFHVFGDNLAARTMYEKLGFIQQTW